MLLIGDGILCVLDPKRHCLLWETGPKPWREMIDEFAEHPAATRAFGLLEAAVGVVLATGQKPSLTDRL